jgi:aminomethyltransferase
MPIATPLHERTKALCESYLWKEWAGYYSVCSYDTHHDQEYHAFRQSCGIIDLTPLFKYKVTGKDACNFLNYMMTRNVSKLAPGASGYTTWCDQEGKVIDDGVVMCISENEYWFTAAIPSFSWFMRYADSFSVEFEDITDNYAIIGLQGPTSHDLCTAVFGEAARSLGFFKHAAVSVVGEQVGGQLSRTGYTGDLGYEIWVDKFQAAKVYDAIMAKAPLFSALPAGLDALDVARIEAGFIMNGVDYYSAHHCPIEERKSSPYEVGLGWTVHFKNRGDFVGKEALLQEKKAGSKWATVGVEYNWNAYEKLFRDKGLPPGLCSKASRSSVPIYALSERQVGYCTSSTWSPILKKSIALATIESDFQKIGQEILVEVTVEHIRKTVPATVVTMPFFNPKRKTARLDQTPVDQKSGAAG